MNANQTPCQGVTGFLFGHKFRARYDTQEIPHFSPQSVELAKRPDLGDLIKASQDGLQESEDILEVIDKLCSNKPAVESHDTYIGDVCVRCGLTVQPNK